jgi:hypothetical protein
VASGELPADGRTSARTHRSPAPAVWPSSAQSHQRGRWDVPNGRLDASGFVSVGEGASLERKVEYLLGRERLAQETFGTLERRLADVESRRFEELRREVEGHVSEAIAEAEGRYRPLRILGGLALVAGVVCLSVANFV